MTPYYQDEAVTIYHGDCREYLPLLGAGHLLIADPPYGIDLDTDYGRFSGSAVFNAKKGHYQGKSYKRVGGDSEPFDPTHLLGHSPRSVLFGADHYAHLLPSSGGWFIWDKREELGSNMLSDAELAWTSFKTPTRIFRHKWLGYMRASEVGFHVHPTQKPVALMRWIIDRSTAAGETVIDPYMGSGPIERAAKDLGRKAIGIEIEERYCEIAARRMAQEVFSF